MGQPLMLMGRCCDLKTSSVRHHTRVVQGNEQGCVRHERGGCTADSIDDVGLLVCSLLTFVFLLPALDESRRIALLNLVKRGEMTVQEALTQVAESKQRSNCALQ